MSLRKKIKKFNIYRRVKLFMIKSMFKRIKDKEENLSSTEYFCLECIYLMDKPTITQFADFLDISSPNATYKVKSLIKKGFITKERSAKDGREYLLVPTQKFYDDFVGKEEEMKIKVINKNLNKEESKKIEKIMDILSEQI